MRVLSAALEGPGGPSLTAPRQPEAHVQLAVLADGHAAAVMVLGPESPMLIMSFSELTSTTSRSP